MFFLVNFFVKGGNIHGEAFNIRIIIRKIYDNFICRAYNKGGEYYREVGRYKRISTNKGYGTFVNAYRYNVCEHESFQIDIFNDIYTHTRNLMISDFYPNNYDTLSPYGDPNYPRKFEIALIHYTTLFCCFWSLKNEDYLSNKINKKYAQDMRHFSESYISLVQNSNITFGHLATYNYNNSLSLPNAVEGLDNAFIKLHYVLDRYARQQAPWGDLLNKDQCESQLSTHQKLQKLFNLNETIKRLECELLNSIKSIITHKKITDEEQKRIKKEKIDDELSLLNEVQSFIENNLQQSIIKNIKTLSCYRRYIYNDDFGVPQKDEFSKKIVSFFQHFIEHELPQTHRFFKSTRYINNKFYCGDRFTDAMAKLVFSALANPNNDDSWADTYKKCCSDFINICNSKFKKYSTYPQEINLDKFHKIKIQHFCKNILEPLIEHTLNKIMHDQPIELINITPIEFEVQCTHILSCTGWNAQRTPATGDQGADIVAKKDDTTIVVQCKKHQSPIGNKAVQEITAAMGYYNANLGFVVSVSGYTESAKLLAASNGIFLLDYSELQNIDKFVIFKE